jgi:tRNA-Thr(GGU) m(6)t(6)A37 methyltransferase TsaA
MLKTIELKPIGHVLSKVTERKDENWGETISRIVLKPEYVGGLSGMEAFSHALIVTFLHEATFERAKHLRRRPRGRADMPELGIFSQRAKNRPNPVGITAVSIIDVADEYLDVRGLDAVNSTPVLDIKPYFPHYDRINNPMVPDWVDELMKNYF